MTQPIEVGVAAHYFCGGVKIGAHAQSTLPGLYAVGECSGGPHGAARVGGNSLTEVLVFGKRAGHHAAGTAAGSDFAAADDNQIDAECERLLGFFDPSRDGDRPADLIQRLKKTMGDHVGVVRNDGGLRRALAEIVARACLERTESRGSHYRDDFTGTNDADWRQDIVIRRRGGALSIDAALELEKA